jgi:hypothetical protein
MLLAVRREECLNVDAAQVMEKYLQAKKRGRIYGEIPDPLPSRFNISIRTAGFRKRTDAGDESADEVQEQ